MELGEIPEDLPEVEISAEGQTEVPVAAILRMANLVQNSNAARDVLARGVVFVDGEQKDQTFKFAVGDTRIIQAGKKKIARVTLS